MKGIISKSLWCVYCFNGKGDWFLYLTCQKYTDARRIAATVRDEWDKVKIVRYEQVKGVR